MNDPIWTEIDARCGRAYPMDGWYKVFKGHYVVYGLAIAFGGYMEVRRDQIIQDSINIAVMEAYPVDSSPDTEVGDWLRGLGWYFLRHTPEGHRALLMADIQAYLG